MDKKKIEKAIGMLLEAIGENPKRPGIRKTPERYSRMCEEIFSGIGSKVEGILKALPSEDSRDLVLVKDIPFYSVCEHHLLPFFGKAHIAYLPSDRVVGLSKLARLLDALSKRLQVQERLTYQVASLIHRELKPRGVLVVIEALHLCMNMRGVKKEGSKVITLSAKGVFARQDKKAEILRLLRR